MKNPFHLAIKKTKTKKSMNTWVTGEILKLQKCEKKNEIYMVELMAISITYLSIYNT